MHRRDPVGRASCSRRAQGRPTAVGARPRPATATADAVQPLSPRPPLAGGSTGVPRRSPGAGVSSPGRRGSPLLGPCRRLSHSRTRDSPTAFNGPRPPPPDGWTTSGSAYVRSCTGGANLSQYHCHDAPHALRSPWAWRPSVLHKAMKRHARRRAAHPARAAASLPPPPQEKPSPADQTDTGPVESFTLLIVGNMNPAIHHPSWYQMTGVMHAEEAEFAQAKPMVCTPALSQFGIKDLEILCDAQRWGATTRDASQIDRIRQIASKTFDLLTQTPLSSYSLIFHQHRLFVRDVGPFLASLVERLPIGFATPGGRRAASVRQVIYESNREDQTAVEPSDRRNH